MKQYLRILLISFFFAFFCISLSYSQDVQFDTLEVKRVIVPKEHLIGLRYSYSLTGVAFTPDLKQSKVNTPLNFALLYTYYHPMWGFMNYFGLQTGVKYGKQGFKTKYNQDGMDQIMTVIEVPLTSQFKFDIGKRFRIMLHLGVFAGYRLDTDREGGFDCFDKRLDYGLLGGGGFAVKLHPVEFHLEASYQYSFSMLYHPEKFSSTGWIYSYPNQINFSFGVHFKLF